ncbi:MAG TPA: glycosyltransferase family 39 protein [Candidatus Limnocylindrales bacterium]
MTSITRPGVGTGVPIDGSPSRAPRARAISALGTLIRGRADEAAWVRSAQLGVMAIAAVLYLVNLTVSGFANTYYSAASLAASQSWSAWFFGSFDAANFITVDKPPLATMLMSLSVRLFGLNSLAILLPEALAGVATVGVLFVLVRRSFGPVAAVIAGLVMALTPAAVLMFRYNNPDALLTLLLVLAAWAAFNAIESGRFRWIIAAAIFVGLGFNTKYLQAWLVVPAFAIAYSIAAPGGIRRRLAGLVVAGVALIVASGWWVLAAALIPAANRPYIGGSTTNSALQLLLGYDGLARIFGGSGAGPGGGGGGGGGGFSGATGILRLFNSQFGGQVSWLIPFSIVGLVSGLLMRGRASRTDGKRAAYLLWGGWLAVHALVFSFMSGIVHSYYSVAMAPAIAALVGAGAVDLWALRSRSRFGGLALAATILASAIWAYELLARTPDFAPGLGLAILVVGALVAVVVAVPATVARYRTQLLAAGLGMAILLAAPAAYAFDTIGTGYSGGDPQAGPATADSGFGGGGGPGGNFGAGGPRDGGFRGAPPGTGTGSAGSAGSVGRAGAAGGAAGGNLGSSSALVTYLTANRGDATWIVATTSAQNAGTIELASGEPVMAMGGFMGSDPAPTLAQLQTYVKSGHLRYVLVGGGGFGPGGASGSGSNSSQIDAWVASVGTVVDYGGTGGATLYDVSGAFASGS